MVNQKQWNRSIRWVTLTLFAGSLSTLSGMAHADERFGDQYLTYDSMDLTTCESVVMPKKADTNSDLHTMLGEAEFPKFTMNDPTCKKTKGDQPISYCVQAAKCKAVFKGEDGKTRLLSAGTILSCESVQDKKTKDWVCPDAAKCAAGKVEISFYSPSHPILDTPPPSLPADPGEDSGGDKLGAGTKHA